MLLQLSGVQLIGLMFSAASALVKIGNDLPQLCNLQVNASQPLSSLSAPPGIGNLHAATADKPTHRDLNVAGACQPAGMGPCSISPLTSLQACSTALHDRADQDWMQCSMQVYSSRQNNF